MEILRPQEPKKPYPYIEEEIVYKNKEAGISLAGTLTLPSGDAPFPVVLLISGSGPQDRNETIYNHRPFLVLAINGEKDLQVPPKENLSAIEEALKSGGNQDYTIKEIPNLNHLFQTAQIGLPSEYAKIEETILPAALKIVGDWILEQTETK